MQRVSAKMLPQGKSTPPLYHTIPLALCQEKKEKVFLVDNREICGKISL